MKNDHTFIFTPGVWIGHGKITISGTKDDLQFITKWTVAEIENGVIKAEQQVEKQEVEEVLVNNFRFFNFSKNLFDVEIENEVLGKITKGQGKFDETSIIWAFQDVLSPDIIGLAGVEMYSQSSDDDYKLHAEYYLDEDHKTIIEGHIWRKK